MARIRTIKPEFPQSQSMGKVSRDARLLFIELWTIADDEGRTRAASRMLASLLFPYDDDAPSLIEGWLGELEAVGCIVRYTIDGDDYLEVCKWSDHQKIDRPSKSKFPPSRGLASPRECSSLDQGPRTKDQGPVPSAREAREDSIAPQEPEGQSKPQPASRPDDVPEPLWREWVAFRKAKRAPITQLVVDQTRRKATEAGMSMPDALTHWIAQGQVGFFPPKPAAGFRKVETPKHAANGLRVVHPDRMPVPHDSPADPCFCGACVSARKRKGESA